jgi:hypothetical protein
MSVYPYTYAQILMYTIIAYGMVDAHTHPYTYAQILMYAIIVYGMVDAHHINSALYMHIHTYTHTIYMYIHTYTHTCMHTITVMMKF